MEQILNFKGECVDKLKMDEYTMQHNEFLMDYLIQCKFIDIC